MGFFEQKHPHYGNQDPVGIMRDIRLVTPSVSSTDEIRRDIEMRCLQLIHDPSIHNANLRNTILQAKDVIVGGHTWDTTGLINHDATNIEYHRLLSLREILLKNPGATLQALEQGIYEALSKHNVSMSNLNSIRSIIENTTGANFTSNLQSMRMNVGHTGEIYFLEGCIEKGCCLDEIILYSRKKCEDISKKRNTSHEYWDFRNVLRLAETKIKHHRLEYKNQKGAKAFVISGGAGNTLASLGVILAHLEAGGTIQALSGTSMGAMIAVLIGSIGNEKDKVVGLIDDIIQGFTIDGEKFSIPKGDLYKPWNARRAKKYIEKLLYLHGIEKDTTFEKLKIPVIVNAGRQYKGGEQEIVLGGGDNIHNAILASMNVPIPGFSNYGGIGTTMVDGVALIDYAANERGNPNHWIETLGIHGKDEILIDAGYSSETWNEDSPTKTRKVFLRATQRDFFAKLRTLRQGGQVYNIDPSLAGKNSSGGIIHPKKTRLLIAQGKELYNKFQGITSPISL